MAARGTTLVHSAAPNDSAPHGELLVGPRPDSSSYRKTERDALTEIAGPLAQALAIARARATRENDHAHALSLLNSVVTAIEDRLNRLEAGARPKTPANT